MQLDVQRRGTSSIVTISGDVDVTTSPELRDILLDLIRKRKQTTVIVDLSKVSHIDSSCIASLLEGLQEAKQHNGRFVLTGLREGPRQLLELTRLLNTFEIRPSVAEALAARE